MKIGAPREIREGEARVAMTPDSARQIIKLGYDCLIETGAGAAAGFADSAYTEAGVEIAGTAEALWSGADIVVKVREPTEDEIDRLTDRHTLISLFWPAQNEAALERARATGATVLAMDNVPRISRAQKLDVLSSMANIGGYRAVIEAGANFGRFFNGQITAAGKVPPAKVLVIGAGVAGLSAIGTATALGAVVRAFDVRPEVAEQIESMGAEFLFLDFAEDGSGEGGYAKPASEEFIATEMELFREQAPDVDIVITTALIPGKPAPRLWPQEMVERMKPGSVIVDLAAERGGNCEATVPDQRIVTENGVVVLGYTDYPSRMAMQSSTLFATNIRHMLTDLTPEKDGQPVIDMEDAVIRGVTVAHKGETTYPPPAVEPPPSPKPAQEKPKEPTAEEKRAAEKAAFRHATFAQVGMLAVGGVLMVLLGLVAPTSFMSHFIVFALACFVGFQVIWGVSGSLHTPLMSITNAISGIIILGALLQIGSGNWIVVILAAISVLIASINVVGGFLVTRRMLAMFQRS